MAGDGVAGASFNSVEGAFELVIGERFDFAAVVADEMVVVFAAGVDGLEARGSGTDVDALNEAVPGELLECSVDARGAGAAAFGAQLVEDLLCG